MPDGVPLTTLGIVAMPSAIVGETRDRHGSETHRHKDRVLSEDSGDPGWAGKGDVHGSLLDAVLVVGSVVDGLGSAWTLLHLYSGDTTS